MRKSLVIVLCVLDAVLALAATEGAASMIRDPTGEAMGFALEPKMLEGTPFRDFLVPGITLLVANGLIPIVAIAGSVVRPRFLTAPLHFGVASILLG